MMFNRSDYFLGHVSGADAPERLLQVELNTIAVAFPWITDQVKDWLREQNQSIFKGCCTSSILVDLLARGDDLFRGHFKQEETVLLMVVQADEKNVYDQLGIVELLANNHKKRMLRLTLSEINAKCHQIKGNLTIEEIPISVVYYRTGYRPEDYANENGTESRMLWDARRLLETSKAIKCPDVGSQLAGMKRVQQELASDPNDVWSILALPSSEEALVKSTFVGMAPLDDAKQVTEVLGLGATHYVIKPQSEGGGNNLYGRAEDVQGMINGIAEDQRASYILMERIEPVEHETIVLQDSVCLQIPKAVSEVGFYGAFLSDNQLGEIMTNRAAGYLVRTKAVDVDEGGVTSGHACLNTLQLII